MARSAPSGSSSAAGVEMPADRTALRPAVAAAVSTGRGLELALLAFAAVITTGALVLVEANQEQELTPALLYLGAAYLGLLAIAHVAVRILAPYADPLVLPLAALLNGLGLVMIHRIDLANIARAARLGNEPPAQDAIRQIGWTAVGLVLFVSVLALVKDHRTLARYGYTAGFVGLFALVLPGLLPASMSEVNGAKIWIRVGGIGIQPGEFAKVLLVVFFASFLVVKRDLFTTAGKRLLGMTFPRPRDLAPLLVAWGIAMGVLVFQSDLGTSLMFFGIVLAMLYVATERVSWVLIGLSIFAAGAFAAWTFVSRVQLRVSVWLDPFADFDNTGFQVGQGLFGLATGGVAGTGLGAGRPDLVPLSSSDFIITSLGEELGLVGLSAIFLLYVLLSTRALRSALAVRDTFGKFLAGGLGFALAWQLFVVAGGVINLIPNTGQTAPFVSYGGSSLVANYALIALVLRVSNAARQPASEKPQRPAGHAPIAEAHTEMVSRDQVAAAPAAGRSSSRGAERDHEAGPPRTPPRGSPDPAAPPTPRPHPGQPPAYQQQPGQQQPGPPPQVPDPNGRPDPGRHAGPGPDMRPPPGGGPRPGRSPGP